MNHDENRIEQVKTFLIVGGTLIVIIGILTGIAICLKQIL